MLIFSNKNVNLVFQLSDAAMAPNHQVSLGPEIAECAEEAVAQTDEPLKIASETRTTPPTQIVSKEADELYLPYKWFNIFAISTFHIVAIYGFYVTITEGSWLTILWSKSQFFIGDFNA